MYATSPEQHRAAEVRDLAATIYTEHHDRLRNIALGNCGRWAEAEDAIQEAFAIFIASFDPASGSPPLAWLMLTLKRRCWAATDRRRMATRRGIAGNGYCPATRMVDQAEGRADTVGAAERVRQTREGMERMKPEQRRALSLLALGYSYSEIAERVGLSEKQVDHRLQGARVVLRAG